MKFVIDNYKPNTSTKEDHCPQLEACGSNEDYVSNLLKINKLSNVFSKTDGPLAFTRLVQGFGLEIQISLATGFLFPIFADPGFPAFARGGIPPGEGQCRNIGIGDLRALAGIL